MPTLNNFELEFLRVSIGASLPSRLASHLLPAARAALDKLVELGFMADNKWDYTTTPEAREYIWQWDHDNHRFEYGAKVQHRNGRSAMVIEILENHRYIRVRPDDGSEDETWYTDNAVSYIPPEPTLIDGVHLVNTAGEKTLCGPVEMAEAPKVIKNWTESMSGKLNHFSLTEDNRDTSLAKVNRLMAAARKDFPSLLDSEIEIVVYGGDKHAWRMAIEFSLSVSVAVPQSYENTLRLETCLF